MSFQFFNKNQNNIKMKQLFQRGLLLVSLLLGLVFSITAQSTQMIVTLNDGTEKSFTMA